MSFSGQESLSYLRVSVRCCIDMMELTNHLLSTLSRGMEVVDSGRDVHTVLGVTEKEICTVFEEQHYIFDRETGVSPCERFNLVGVNPLTDLHYLADSLEEWPPLHLGYKRVCVRGGEVLFSASKTKPDSYSWGDWADKREERACLRQ